MYYICRLIGNINPLIIRIMTAIIIIVAVVVLLALWAVGIYNSLVKLRNNRENAFANIDVQLKQRHDLIPQLVATVKGYAQHEKELLTRVTEARAAAMNATGINDKIQAENQLSSALAGLRVSLEAYPDLKANQNFLELQSQLEGTENRITVERNKFNEVAKEYNTKRRTFPTNIIAGVFGFGDKPYFQAQPGADVAPKVDFGTSEKK